MMTIEASATAFAAGLSRRERVQELGRARPHATSAEDVCLRARVSPRRILTVDDVPALANAIARTLQIDGHTAVAVTSGEAALERLAAEPFDVVISDMGMGDGMDGWELAAAIRHRYPSVRVVLMTGWASELPPEQVRAHGIEAVIKKPCRAASLQDLVATLDAAERPC